MDNHHVYLSDSSVSCGILEASRLSEDPKKVLYSIANHLYHPARGSAYAMVQWSDVAENNSHGQKLAMEAAMFGGLYCSPPVENPKTTNKIQLFIWTIPHETFKEWYRKERVERARKL